MEDVREILEYSPGSTENSNWHMALYAHNKPFVAHHHFQNFHREKLRGKNFQWDNFLPIVKFFFYPYAILLSLISPFVVVFDAIFRNSDILFLPPEALKQNRQAVMEMIEMPEMNGSHGVDLNDDEHRVENQVMGHFRTNFHRPIFRIIFQHFMDIIFLLSLGLTLADPLDEGGEVSDDKRKKELHFYDYISTILIVSNLVESVIELAGRRWHSISSYWQMYNILTYLLLFAGGLTYFLAFQSVENDIRANLSGNHSVNIGATFFAIGGSLAFLTPLRWFLLNRSLGPVVVCIIKVLKDAFHIFIIFMIVFVAFAIPSYFMFKPFSIHSDKYYLHQDDLVTFRGLFGVMFWQVSLETTIQGFWSPMLMCFLRSHQNFHVYVS